MDSPKIATQWIGVGLLAFAVGHFALAYYNYTVGKTWIPLAQLVLGLVLLVLGYSYSRRPSTHLPE